MTQIMFRASNHDPAFLEKILPNKPNLFHSRFYVVLFLTGVGTFLVHEFAHWITGVLLGYDMTITLNSVSPIGPVTRSDQAFISAAGPTITIIQAIIGYQLVKRLRSELGFALLYIAFFMRLIAAGISIFHANDEAKVSQILGLGTWTLPIAVVSGLLILVVLASKKLHVTARDQFLCYAVSSAVISLIVVADMVLWPKGGR